VIWTAWTNLGTREPFHRLLEYCPSVSSRLVGDLTRDRSGTRGGGGGGGGHGFGGGHAFGGFTGRPGFSGTRGFSSGGFSGRANHARFDDRGFRGRARDFRDFDGDSFDFSFYGFGYPEYYPDDYPITIHTSMTTAVLIKASIIPGTIERLDQVM